MTAWGGGKGSTYRPTDTSKWSDNYDKIFGGKNNGKESVRDHDDGSAPDSDGGRQDGDEGQQTDQAGVVGAKSSKP